MNLSCEICGESIPLPPRGRTPRFCSSRCRVRNHRRKAVALPAELTSLNRWTRADGKRPIQIDGSPASSTSPVTWSSFAEVRKSTAGDGFGIMLGNGLGCYDLDHCLDDDRLTTQASELLASVDPIWAERSMSGTGLHIFVTTDETAGFRRGRIEFYPRGRFIRVTGDRFIF